MSNTAFMNATAWFFLFFAIAYIGVETWQLWRNRQTAGHADRRDRRFGNFVGLLIGVAGLIGLMQHLHLGL